MAGLIALMKGVTTFAPETGNLIVEKLGIPLVETVLQEGREKLAHMGEHLFVKDVASEFIPVHSSLAASFGNLTEEGFIKMDDHLKIAIAATVKTLLKTQTAQMSWDEVLSIFNTNSLLEPVGGASMDNSDRLIKDQSLSFAKDGVPDRNIVNEVDAWFTELLFNKNDIRKSTKIDIEDLGLIVAATGVVVDSFESIFFKNEYHEKTVVELGLIRFPDFEHPYIQVYRIKLKAWNDRSRYLFLEKNTRGILGQFNAVQYRPRKSVMEKISKEAHDAGVESANNLLLG